MLYQERDVWGSRLSFYYHVDYILSSVRRIYFGYHGLLRMKGGLPQEQRLLIYRPVISWVFPLWFSIGSHHMEGLRLWERRVFRPCWGLRCAIAEDGTCRYPTCRAVYSGSSFIRVDTVMIYSALSQLENNADIENPLLENSLRNEGDLESLVVRRYPSPAL